MSRLGGLLVAAVGGLICLVMAGSAVAAKPAVVGEQSVQNYWHCDSSKSTLGLQAGPNPHHPADGTYMEYTCLDSELKAAGFKSDPAATATGGWKPPLGYAAATPIPSPRPGNQSKKT